MVWGLGPGWAVVSFAGRFKKLRSSSTRVGGFCAYLELLGFYEAAVVGVVLPPGLRWLWEEKARVRDAPGRAAGARGESAR